MTGRRTLLILAVIGMMMAMSMTPIGVASSYSATTASTGNAIHTDYFTVGLYEIVEDERIPASTNSLVSNPITYTQTSGGKVINGEHVLTPEGIVLRVHCSSPAITSVTLDTPVISITDNGTPIPNTSYELTVGTSTWTSSGWTGSTTIAPDTDMSVSLKMTLSSAYTIISENLYGNVSIILTATVSPAGMSGTYTETKICTLETGGIIEEITDLNGSLTNDNYSFNESDVDYGDDYVGVNIEGNDQHGISRPNSSNGKYEVDIDITVPEGYEFLIVLRGDIDTDGEHIQSILTVTITYSDGTEYIVKSPGSINTTDRKSFLCKYKGNIYSVSSMGQIEQYPDSYKWFEAAPDNGSISIHVANYNGGKQVDPELKLDFILKPTE